MKVYIAIDQFADEPEEIRGVYRSREGALNYGAYVREEELNILSFKDYQTQTATTAVYPESDTLPAMMYLGLGLNGEAGEVADLLKKVYRDDGTIDLVAFRSEIGDVLWYLSQLCTELGLTLEEVAVHNLVKLADRRRRGVIQGSGDYR